MTIDLDDTQCRNMLPPVAINMLAANFNKRKPRKHLPPVSPDALILSGKLTFQVCSRLLQHPSAFDNNNGVIELEDTLVFAENATLDELVQLGTVMLTHATVGDIPPSSVYVDDCIDKTRFSQLYMGSFEKELVAMVTERVTSYRNALPQVREQTAARAQRFKEQEARDLLEGIKTIRRLPEAAARVLGIVVTRIRDMKGISDDDRAYLLAQMSLVLKESRAWDKAVREARHEMQSERADEMSWPMLVPPWFHR